MRLRLRIRFSYGTQINGMIMISADKKSFKIIRMDPSGIDNQRHQLSIA